jgi:hypothetical protein
MKRPGAPDPTYVRARRVLLDALQALGAHREAIVLVGAQAIYLHTGEGDLAVAPYTTDADLALAPADLEDSPRIDHLLVAAGFTRTDQPGRWRSGDSVVVDLMVPAALAGTGSRGARLGPHGKYAARKAKGLEAALIDRTKLQVGALDRSDSRRLTVWVAGPAALLVAKLHKISERVDSPGRQDDKDAHDVLRLLQHIPTAALAQSSRRLLTDPLSSAVTREALDLLRSLFGGADAAGPLMAARATEGLEDAVTITTSCAVLASELLAELTRSS